MLVKVLAGAVLLGGACGSTQLAASEEKVPPAPPIDAASLLASVKGKQHPCLLFKDIKETPGYRYREKSPWSQWESHILTQAKTYLSKDFSEITLRRWAAIYRGLAYQLTGETQYADKVKAICLSLRTYRPPLPSPAPRHSSGYQVKTGPCCTLMTYSLAYDFVQRHFSKADDRAVRDKLAQLADDVYHDLTDSGKERSYVVFTHYEGHAYPALGIAGCALYDYTNPNNLPLKTGPLDWLKVGTDYLFVNDPLHVYDKSLLDLEFDSSGRYSIPAYKTTFYRDFLWWYQVYSGFFGKNICEVYPIAQKVMTVDLWSSLPNRYSHSLATMGNCKQFYHRAVINLLDDDYKAYMLKHDDIIENSNVLPYYGWRWTAPEPLLYLVYEDYSSIERRDPQWTSHLSDQSPVIEQVFRANWKEDGDWLAFITFNLPLSRYWRAMSRGDQLSFEYYSKGDLLLANGGEPKHVETRATAGGSPALEYGMDPVFSNTVLIEDPRTPFQKTVWADSEARGLYKGEPCDLVTPASVRSLIRTPWMELVEATVSIEYVVGSGRLVRADAHSARRELSSPIAYSRSVLFPNKEYFVIVDRFEGREPWVYRNLFRFTSLNITPTKSKADIGHVNGQLTLGGKAYDWQALPYKKETALKTTASSIRWATKNPYDKEVHLQLFSAPSSEILAIKHVTRIGGYGISAEVFSPCIYFREGKARKDLYRVTALLSRYASEEEKTAEEVAVNGTGSAVKIGSRGWEDIVYGGKGSSSLEGIATDADVLYLRKMGSKPTAYTMVRGSSLVCSGTPLIKATKKIDSLALEKDGAKIRFAVRGEGKADIALGDIEANGQYKVSRDGKPFAGWAMKAGSLVVTTDLGEHAFEIEPIAR